jgi:hypothetical protein
MKYIRLKRSRRHSATTQKQNRPPRRVRAIFFGLALLSILIAGVFFIKSAANPLFFNIFGALFAVLAVVCGLLQLVPIIFPSDPKSDLSQVPSHFHTQPTTLLEASPLSGQQRVDNTNKEGSSKKVAVLHDERETASLSSSSIFLFNMVLPHPCELFGRESQRTALLDRTRKESSTCLIGMRGIGKTWLMKYLLLVAPAELGPSFRIAYLDASTPGCATISEFVAQALEAFNIPGVFQKEQLTLTTLEEVVRNLRAKKVVPVLCIDEFDKLPNLPEEFNKTFFGKLRSLARGDPNANYNDSTKRGLVLVIASKYSLKQLIDDYPAIGGSNILTNFLCLTLEPFNREEAEEFIRQKGALAGFTDDERTRLLEYGEQGENQWPPSRLQFEGQMLLTDKNMGRSTNDPGYWPEFKKRLEKDYQGMYTR